MMEAKMRKDWGFNDWIDFAPSMDHKFNKSTGTCILSDYIECHYFTNSDIDEAARLTVQDYCQKRKRNLPWSGDVPMFMIWTRVQCEDYMKENGCHWVTHNNYIKGKAAEKYAIEIKYPGRAYFGALCESPTLKDFQAAAEYVWTQVNK